MSNFVKMLQIEKNISNANDLFFLQKANLYQGAKYDGRAADPFFDTWTTFMLLSIQILCTHISIYGAYMLTLCGSGLIVLKTSGVPGPIPPNIIIIRKNSETCNKVEMFLLT